VALRVKSLDAPVVVVVVVVVVRFLLKELYERRVCAAGEDGAIRWNVVTMREEGREGEAERQRERERVGRRGGGGEEEEERRVG